jgi:hypothetical protein
MSTKNTKTFNGKKVVNPDPHGSHYFLEAGPWIRIRIVVKSWIRIRIKVKIQKLSRLKIEPWRAVDVNNGGFEVQN